MYLVIFIIMFTFLLFFSLKQLYKNIYGIYRFHYLIGWDFIFSIIRAPINVAMVLIVCISFLKIIWLSTDPFLFHGYLERRSERILDETTYSLLLAVYVVVLVVWYSIYEEICFILNRGRKFIWQLFRFVIKLRLISVFVLQFI